MSSSGERDGPTGRDFQSRMFIIRLLRQKLLAGMAVVSNALGANRLQFCEVRPGPMQCAVRCAEYTELCRDGSELERNYIENFVN